MGFYYEYKFGENWRYNNGTPLYFFIPSSFATTCNLILWSTLKEINVSLTNGFLIEFAGGSLCIFLDLPPQSIASIVLSSVSLLGHSERSKSEYCGSGLLTYVRPSSISEKIQFVYIYPTKNILIFNTHYSDITGALQCLKAHATWLFVQKLVQANNIEIVKLLALCEGNPSLTGVFSIIPRSTHFIITSQMMTSRAFSLMKTSDLCESSWNTNLLGPVSI